MRRFLKIFLKTVTAVVIVFCVYVGSLFFRTARVPAWLTERVLDAVAPTNLLIRCSSLDVSLRDGLTVRDLKVYDRTRKDPLTPVVSAAYIAVRHAQRLVRAHGLTYPRLPDSYYEPGNLEKNARVEAVFPEISEFRIILTEPDILAVRPQYLEGHVSVETNRVSFKDLHLDWPDRDVPMSVDGFCTVDLGAQVVTGAVWGLARQAHIRPLLTALDVPVAYPYMDGFTEVPRPVDARCDWNVNLVNNDFDLWLDLKPDLGRYNGVPMRHADGLIHLCNRIRGTFLNYHQEVVVTNAVGVAGQPLSGRVDIYGQDGTNRVVVAAQSALPLAHLLKIGGFTGDYVADDVVGESSCRLEFRFPRAMTNNYEVLNGRGHVEIKNGQLMRMKGFKGLVALMAEHVPGVSWFTDCTQATGDYVITNGVIKTDGIYIEGSVFSMKMYGQFDAVADKLDYTVRVQFAQKDSWLGKVLHPLTWPFTKLVTEFRLTGSPAEPKWEYLSVIDRVLEAVK